MTEWLTPDESLTHRIHRYVVKTKTPFQRAEIADTPAFGRCLILDGEMQSAALDEFIYHEALVHPAMVVHPNPKNVLILGGGEGATVRELLKHRSLKQVTMVDIDGPVVDFCKKHLTAWHRGAFSSAKLRLIVGDAKAFVEQTREKFDVILADLPSPLENGPAHALYTIEFYRRLKQRLAVGGVFVTQAGSGSLIQLEMHQVLYSTLRNVFPRVRPYYAYVPSFGVPWAFLMGSDRRDPFKFTQNNVEKIIKRRMKSPLSFYDGMAHVGLFNIPKHLRTLLNAEKRVVSQSRPLSFSR